VDVSQLLSVFALTVDVEVVIPWLPKRWRQIRRPEIHLPSLSLLLAASPRHSLLQHLHRKEKTATRRLADQQMKMFRRHNVTTHGEVVLCSDFFKNLQKEILTVRRRQKLLPTVTGARDEMLIPAAVNSSQPLGHLVILSTHPFAKPAKE
jgi:hypothetical protein